MSVEEKFDIEIPDEEAAEMRCVADLYAFVLGEVRSQPRARCMSSAVFYQARRALMELYGNPRWSIRPSTPMDRLLPVRSRRAHWENLRRSLETRLPELELPPWTTSLARAVRAAHALTCVAALLAWPLASALLYCMVSSLIVWAIHRTGAMYAIHVPAACATVGSTVKTVLTLSYNVRTGRPREWTPEDVWKTLRDVIVEQLAVAPEAVTPDAHFVDDLGFD